ncbi:MAG: hypothetical protein Q9M91_05940 [Candidatus Dojkabacteria bacterium]|nr:hypothetical protein [Candidatus Dojkabacteria bacterium]
MAKVFYYRVIRNEKEFNVKYLYTINNHLKHAEKWGYDYPTDYKYSSINHIDWTDFIY